MRTSRVWLINASNNKTNYRETNMLINSDLTLQYLSKEFEIDLDDLIVESRALKILGQEIINNDVLCAVSRKDAEILLSALKPEALTKFVLLYQSQSGLS